MIILQKKLSNNNQMKLNQSKIKHLIKNLKKYLKKVKINKKNKNKKMTIVKNKTKKI